MVDIYGYPGEAIYGHTVDIYGYRGEDIYERFGKQINRHDRSYCDPLIQLRPRKSFSQEEVFLE